MRWLRRWWRDVNQSIDRDVEAHVQAVFGDLLRAATLARKYERLERYFPNILARLNAAAERKDK